MDPVIAESIRLLHETADLEELLDGWRRHQVQAAVEANCEVCPFEPHDCHTP